MTPGQTATRNIRNMVCELRGRGKTVDLEWVKGYQGTPGNEKADVLAGRAAEKAGYSKIMSISHLKLRISEKFRTKKRSGISPRDNTERKRYPLPRPRSLAWTE
jgi:ribonuclease HI